MELGEAEIILGLCRQFNCLPSQLEQEDATILRLLWIEQLGTPKQNEEDYDG